ncbi:MAG: DUF4062 domain-containing protein [Bacteriodetes bacterium]|nr:DUF4062 domain-containing protein [Bacteroidota bacterium]
MNSYRKQVHVYKCFVASPGDTVQERDACRVAIEDINSTIGDYFNFRIEYVGWETHTHPGIASYSQEVINKQINDDYDIFIGIMHKRFGTPTKKAGSGTEEEFDRAYLRWEQNKSIEIMFYFNSDVGANSLDELDLGELEKVRSFKQKISNSGAMYWSYKGVRDFESNLKKHLTSVMLNKYNLDGFPDENERIRAEGVLLLKQRLNSALRTFRHQPLIWVDPILSRTNLISQNASENYKTRVETNEIIASDQSFVILAPPQFGLTCLAHHLNIEAWSQGQNWVYVDCEECKPQNIVRNIIEESKKLRIAESNIHCIIVDSWVKYRLDSNKKIQNILKHFPKTKIILMQRIEDSTFLREMEEIDFERQFENLHLIALPRNQIRRIVSEYNKEKEIATEDALLTKVISDLNILNIHRTPYNCLTLLKVSENNFDESPINRTSMIEAVLFVLFNLDGIPRYNDLPDIKDCEYVLGRYCEQLIRDQKTHFLRDEFITSIKAFCKEKLISLNIDLVFDILELNSIIVKHFDGYCFRASFWIFYFAAKRMHTDETFRNYVYSSKTYLTNPEIIEFYTGIDRSRTDAVIIVENELRRTIEIVEQKIQISSDFNPFNSMQWNPTEEQLTTLKNKISDTIQGSGLPEVVKDQHADSQYDQLRPYDQRLLEFFDQYYVYNLFSNIKVACRTLRNSDYISPDRKRSLMDSILASWLQVSNVLFALTPIMAQHGFAGIGGLGFFLSENFSNDYNTRILEILTQNLVNTVGYFRLDLFSQKIGPLLYDRLEVESNEKTRHQLVLILIHLRPRYWRKHVEGYIKYLNKNSFYLYDIYNALLNIYNFDYLSDDDINNTRWLIKYCFAKHEYQSKHPTLADIKRVRVKNPRKRSRS